MAEYLTKTEHLKAVADAIRAKGGTSAPLAYPSGFVSAIQAIPSGSGSGPVAPGDITFYDYDGTVVAAWSLTELAGKTALPDLPVHSGLICQGWNWTLAGLKAGNGKMNVGANYITDDGKTRIYIKLVEGRTAPVLGCCPNGTVTVDWGDGTEPDTLTGTSTSTLLFTPAHNYATPGEYVISLTAPDGEATTLRITGGTTESGAGLLNYAGNSDNRNAAYKASIQKVEIGERTTLSSGALANCYGLRCVATPRGVGYGVNAFLRCYSLKSIAVSSLGGGGNNVFSYCYGLKSVQIAESGRIAGSATGVLFNCVALTELYLNINDNGALPSSMVSGAYGIREIGLASSGETGLTISNNAFSNCHAVALVTITGDIDGIESNAFARCVSCKLYDFSQTAEVPTLGNISAFTGIPDDCEIRVPAALSDEWKAATNWATYADYIVGV
nr:MAG TPA: leucine-rich repeat protein [Caudoviricetes sp.]